MVNEFFHDLWCWWTNKSCTRQTRSHFPTCSSSQEFRHAKSLSVYLRPLLPPPSYIFWVTRRSPSEPPPPTPGQLLPGSIYCVAECVYCVAECASRWVATPICIPTIAQQPDTVYMSNVRWDYLSSAHFRLLPVWCRSGQMLTFPPPTHPLPLPLAQAPSLRKC